MKIGIFGGSFNPIHKSHIKIVKAVLDKNIFDEVWIVPCYAHNFGKSLENYEDRVKMISLAFEDFPKIKICEIEKGRKGTSKTYDTILELREKYNHEFVVIVGSDILYEIDKWSNSEKLLKEVSFVIYEREGFPSFRKEGMKILSVVSEKIDDISSTEIRKRITESLRIDDLVPEKVEEYIIKNSLYK